MDEEELGIKRNRASSLQARTMGAGLAWESEEVGWSAVSTLAGRGGGGRSWRKMSICSGVNGQRLAAYKPGGWLPVVKEIETALLGKSRAALG